MYQVSTLIKPIEVQAFTSKEKKAFLLLASVIFHYHGLDEEERNILQETALDLNGHQELNWANHFIAEDYSSSFERTRYYLNQVDLSQAQKLDYLYQVWMANNRKGYVTEMEATAILSLAKDWKLENEILAKVRS